MWKWKSSENSLSLSWLYFSVLTLAETVEAQTQMPFYMKVYQVDALESQEQDFASLSPWSLFILIPARSVAILYH